MATSVIAAASARAEREIVAHFRDVRATSPDRPIDPPSLGPMGLRQFRRLLDAGVLRPEGRAYWLDESMYASYRTDRRTALVAALVAVLAVVIAVLLAQRA